MLCAEFLNARRIDSVWNAPNFDMCARWHFIVLMAAEGGTRKRLWTVHRQYSFGAAICFLSPIVVVMNGDYDGKIFQKHPWSLSQES